MSRNILWLQPRYFSKKGARYDWWIWLEQCLYFGPLLFLWVNAVSVNRIKYKAKGLSRIVLAENRQEFQMFFYTAGATVWSDGFNETSAKIG